MSKFRLTGPAMWRSTVVHSIRKENIYCSFSLLFLIYFPFCHKHTHYIFFYISKNKKMLREVGRRSESIPAVHRRSDGSHSLSPHLPSFLPSPTHLPEEEEEVGWPWRRRRRRSPFFTASGWARAPTGSGSPSTSKVTSETSGRVYCFLLGWWIPFHGLGGGWDNVARFLGLIGLGEIDVVIRRTLR